MECLLRARPREKSERHIGEQALSLCKCASGDGKCSFCGSTGSGQSGNPRGSEFLADPEVEFGGGVVFLEEGTACGRIPGENI